MTDTFILRLHGRNEDQRLQNSGLLVTVKGERLLIREGLKPG